MSTPAVRYSTILSLVEVGLGSLLHALHVPFRGQALSMNQGFLLSRASFVSKVSTRGEAIRLSNLISLTAACLKSLSPAGRRLTPMLAISIQGLLFSFGQFIGGVSVLGHSIGISLISLWALTQGIVLGWLLNGEAFLDAIRFGIEKIGVERVEWVLGIGILLLLSIGVFLVRLSMRMSESEWSRYEARLSVRRKESTKRFSVPWMAILSVAATIGFLYYTESPEARTIWIWIRPVAVFIGIGLVLHFVPPEKLSAFLGRRWPELGRTVENAHRMIVRGKRE